MNEILLTYKEIGRHVRIDLDLEDLDMPPSEMEQLITRALSGSTMFDKEIKNVQVYVRKLFKEEEV